MPAALSDIVRETVVNLKATGVNDRDVANQLAISEMSVHRIKNAQRDRIFKIANSLIDKSADLVQDNHIKTLQAANAVLSQAVAKDYDASRQSVIDNMKAMGLEPRDLLKIADLKEFRTLQIMGIVPSNSQSLIVNQILGNVSVNLVDPGVRQLLGGQLNQLEDDTQEAELVDSPTNGY
jgi:hypothetical protein